MTFRKDEEMKGFIIRCVNVGRHNIEDVSDNNCFGWVGLLQRDCAYVKEITVMEDFNLKNMEKNDEIMCSENEKLGSECCELCYPYLFSTLTENKNEDDHSKSHYCGLPHCRFCSIQKDLNKGFSQMIVPSVSSWTFPNSAWSGYISEIANICSLLKPELFSDDDV
jgi:hypothetical protein